MKPLLCSSFVTSTTIYHHHFFCLSKDVHQYDARSSSNVHKIQARTNYQKHSVKYKGVSIWNNLPKSIKEIKTFSLSGKKIKTYFLHKQENQNFTILTYLHKYYSK